MQRTNFPIVIDVNVCVGSFVTDRDIDILFGSGQPIHRFDTTTIFDVLVLAGLFESKGQARKNWKGIQNIPTGWTELQSLGKSKLSIFIWNPSF